MIKEKELPRLGPIRPDYTAEAYTKLQHVCKHEEMMEAVAESLIDPNEISEINRDIRGSRRIIFSLLIDLNLVG